MPAAEFSGQRGISCDQPGPNEPIRPENYESQLLPDRHQRSKASKIYYPRRDFVKCRRECVVGKAAVSDLNPFDRHRRRALERRIG